jgi:hypothetical protein
LECLPVNNFNNEKEGKRGKIFYVIFMLGTGLCLAFFLPCNSAVY